MTDGRPYFSNSLWKTGFTASARKDPSICRQKMNRLKASRIVNGSNRFPSRVRHQPLKSTVQTSFGAFTTKG